MSLCLAPAHPWAAFLPLPSDLAIVANPAPRPVRACFGVVCPNHGHCTRYAAVDTSAVDPDTLVTCRIGDRFPLFIVIEPARAVTA